MATKKKAWADLLGTDAGSTAGTDSADEGTQESPATVLMHTIIGNPENPRDDSDYTDDDPEFAELKLSMQEIGQLQPLAVLARSVYERVKPGRDSVLKDAEWVVVTGNRRLAAARQLGWTRIDVKVQDRLGDGDGSMIDEAVIIENIHRKNIAPIKEAEFLQRMVERLGSQDKAAARIGKSQMYVSHRLALLQLAPDVQEDLEAGAVKLKDVRAITRKPHDEQRAAVAAMKQRAAAPKAPKKAAAPLQNPVLKPTPDPVVGQGRSQKEAKPEAQERDPQADLPEPRSSGLPTLTQVEREEAPSGVTWQLLPDGWEAVFNMLRAQMREYDRHMLTKKLNMLMDEELGTAPTGDSA